MLVWSNQQQRHKHINFDTEKQVTLTFTILQYNDNNIQNNIHD